MSQDNGRRREGWKSHNEDNGNDIEEQEEKREEVGYENEVGGDNNELSQTKKRESFRSGPELSLDTPAQRVAPTPASASSNGIQDYPHYTKNSKNRVDDSAVEEEEEEEEEEDLLQKKLREGGAPPLVDVPPRPQPMGAGGVVGGRSASGWGPEEVGDGRETTPMPVEQMDVFVDEDTEKSKDKMGRATQTALSRAQVPHPTIEPRPIPPSSSSPHNAAAAAAAAVTEGEEEEQDESLRDVYRPPRRRGRGRPGRPSVPPGDGEWVDAHVQVVDGGGAGVTFYDTYDATIVRPFPSHDELLGTTVTTEQPPPQSTLERPWLVGTLFQTKRQRNAACLLLLAVLAIVTAVAVVVGGSGNANNNNDTADALADFAAPTESPTEAPSTVAPTPLVTSVPTTWPTLAPTTTEPTAAPSVDPLMELKKRVVSAIAVQVYPSSPPPGTLDWFYGEEFLPALDAREGGVDLLEREDRVRQRYIVGLLWFALNGTHWFRNDDVAASSQWLDGNVHECHWHGVVCSEEEGAVTSLLPFSPSASRRVTLRGTLPPELAFLGSLRRIDWSRQDQLTGTLPTHLGRLTQLSELNLLKGGLRGALPTELGLCTALQTLHLQENAFTGTIPTELGQLSSLESLYLASNEFTGTLPVEWSQLSTLTLVDLGNNNLSGTLPPEWVGMESLMELSLTRLNITGTIPSEYGGFSNLKTMTISGCQIDGTIPTTLGQLGQLEFLQLWENQLDGPLPSELKRAAKLKEILVSTNRLSGTIPPELGDLPLLGALVLTANLFHGTIPPELGKIGPRLNRFDVSSNRLTGSIPSELGMWTKLRFFQAFGNSLTQTIPTELGNLINLEAMFLRHNQLSGTIPPELHSLGSDRTTTPWRLELENNTLRGPIPESFGNMTNCVSLLLGGNDLTGTLSAGLGTLAALEELDVSRNRLGGRLPPELADASHLRLLLLAHNEFSGSFPTEYGRLNQLETLDLTNTSLVGDVPQGICNNQGHGEFLISVDCADMGCTCCQPNCS